MGMKRWHQKQTHIDIWIQNIQEVEVLQPHHSKEECNKYVMYNVMYNVGNIGCLNGKKKTIKEYLHYIL